MKVSMFLSGPELLGGKRHDPKPLIQRNADPQHCWLRYLTPVGVAKDRIISGSGFESWIRIRIVDAHNGGVEAQIGAVDSLKTSGCRFAAL